MGRSRGLPKDMSENKKKICPLMKVAGEPTNSAYCTTECAWYKEDSEQCIILHLAHSLLSLENDIATIVDFGIRVKQR